MKLRLSTVGQSLITKPQRLGSFVITKTPSDAETAGRGRYMESRDKMQRFCRAMAPCPDGWTCILQTTLYVGSFLIECGGYPYFICNLSPLTYRITYLSGATNYCTPPSPGWWALNITELSPCTFEVGTPSAVIPVGPLDSQYRHWQTAEAMALALKGKPNRPFVQWDNPAWAHSLYFRWSAPPSPCGSQFGTFSVALCVLDET